MNTTESTLGFFRKVEVRLHSAVCLLALHRDNIHHTRLLVCDTVKAFACSECVEASVGPAVDVCTTSVGDVHHPIQAVGNTETAAILCCLVVVGWMLFATVLLTESAENIHHVQLLVDVAKPANTGSRHIECWLSTAPVLLTSVAPDIHHVWLLVRRRKGLWLTRVG